MNKKSVQTQEEILGLLRAGKGIRETARLMGVSRTTIKKLIRDTEKINRFWEIHPTLLGAIKEHKKCMERAKKLEAFIKQYKVFAGFT